MMIMKWMILKRAGRNVRRYGSNLEEPRRWRLQGAGEAENAERDLDGT